MATLCRNCSHALVVDPSSRKMACGSFFAASKLKAHQMVLMNLMKSSSFL